MPVNSNWWQIFVEDDTVYCKCCFFNVGCSRYTLNQSVYIGPPEQGDIVVIGLLYIVH